jgi:hypothetical protein
MKDAQQWDLKRYFLAVPVVGCPFVYRGLRGHFQLFNSLFIIGRNTLISRKYDSVAELVEASAILKIL